MNEIFLSDEHTRSELTARIPLARLGTPDDVSGLAVFLASDDSAYCTGGFFMADGGLTAV
jgi:NAD(P)-dependent dehydrogenase (short-subunit alcohol dehydrogenase family)